MDKTKVNAAHRQKRYRRNEAAFFGPLHRLLPVCLSILGLYVQLVAATTCLTALSVQNADASPYPICHQSGPADAGTGHGGPGQDGGQAEHACPLCAAHHATAAPAVPDALPLPAFSYAVTPSVMLAANHRSAVFPSGTSPRGPPASL